jgi:hypothetical protein
MTGSSPQDIPNEGHAGLLLLAAARGSIDSVGDGDWTPQDSYLAAVCDYAEKLREQHQALELQHALAIVLLTDTESLVRHLRPDLDATRPRVDALLKRMDEFSRA